MLYRLLFGVFKVYTSLVRFISNGGGECAYNFYVISDLGYLQRSAIVNDCGRSYSVDGLDASYARYYRYLVSKYIRRYGELTICRGSMDASVLDSATYLSYYCVYIASDIRS